VALTDLRDIPSFIAKTAPPFNLTMNDRLAKVNVMTRGGTRGGWIVWKGVSFFCRVDKGECFFLFF